MSVLGSGASLIRKRAAEASPVGILLLTRLAVVGGATRAEAGVRRVALGTPLSRRGVRAGRQIAAGAPLPDGHAVRRRDGAGRRHP